MKYKHRNQDKCSKEEVEIGNSILDVWCGVVLVLLSAIMSSRQSEERRDSDKVRVQISTLAIFFSRFSSVIICSSKSH
jgi:hypothetical protein